MRAAIKLTAGSGCGRTTSETTVRDFFSVICGEWWERYGACNGLKRSACWRWLEFVFHDL